MTKGEIAAVLEEIATLLELKDENPFKIRAYANAARSLETFGANLSDLQDEDALEKIPGIGKAIAAKIKELAATGSLKYLEELRAPTPAEPPHPPRTQPNRRRDYLQGQRYPVRRTPSFM